MPRRLLVSSLVVLSTASAALADPVPAAGKLVADDVPGPPPEVVTAAAKLELPAIPAFELPIAEPGLQTARGLRVRGKAALGTQVKLKGYVTWVYDCGAALAAGNPRSTRAQIAAAIAKNPALCERPKLALADAKATPRERSLSVVDLPTARRAAPPRVGDYVLATGTWATESPGGERNPDGLLIYEALERAAPPAAPPAAGPASAPPVPDVEVISKAPLRRPVSEAVRRQSIDQANACNGASAAGKHDAAIAACRAATAAWDDNHLAWYVLASAHMAKGEWPQARAAMERAVGKRPDLGMYQLYHGVALYEAEQARPAAERKLEPARDALLRAIKLAPTLWRAHFYLARVFRDLGDDRREAEQYVQTLIAHPAYRFGYTALVELYRRWDYLDEALAVAQLGASRVAPADAGALWLEVGGVYDARHADDQAIDAYGKAIDAGPDPTVARYQRGQVYVRKADYANARRDLEEVARSTDPRLASARQLATRLLAQIAARKP